MDREAYLKSLPKKQVASGAIFLDEQGQLLILHPSYKERWEIPGGTVEAGESPRDAARREVKEEMGLDVEIKQMLVCDYWYPTEGREDNIHFIFFGGILDDSEIDKIQLSKEEISKYEFIPFETDKDRERIGSRPRVGPRVLQALQALDIGESFYLENSKRN